MRRVRLNRGTAAVTNRRTRLGSGAFAYGYRGFSVSLRLVGSDRLADVWRRGAGSSHGYPRSTTESSFTKKNRLGRDRGVNVLGADLNRTIPGLFEHCKRGDKAIFPDVQGWIRIRADSTLVERGA